MENKRDEDLFQTPNFASLTYNTTAFKPFLNFAVCQFWNQLPVSVHLALQKRLTGAVIGLRLFIQQIFGQSRFNFFPVFRLDHQKFPLGHTYGVGVSRYLHCIVRPLIGPAESGTGFFSEIQCLAVCHPQLSVGVVWVCKQVYRVAPEMYYPFAGRVVDCTA